MAIELSEKQIKNGWQIVKFGEIAEHISNRVNPTAKDSLKYIGLEHLDSGSIVISRWGSDVVLKGQKLKMEKGDILFAKRNAYLKRVAVAPFDGIFSAHGMVIRPKGKLILHDLLPFLMQSNVFMDTAIRISEGSLSPTIKWKTLAIQEFKIPPLTRQIEILKIAKEMQKCQIWSDACIEEILTLKRVSISNLYSKTSLQNKSNKVYLKDVCEIVSGQVDPTEQPYASLPHIAPDNMSKSTGQLLEYKTAGEDNVTSGKYAFDDSWFLYSKIRPNLRKICFPKFKGICSADVYPIRGKNGALTSYLFFLMQSEHFNRYAESNSMRSGFPKINRDDLGVYQFYLPDTETQRKTITIIDEYDKTYRELLAHRQKVIKLNINLLSNVFEGGAQ